MHDGRELRAQLAHFLVQLLLQLLGLQQLLVEPQARRGEPNAATEALEQARFVVFFQGLHLLAHRRLADEQRLAGLGEAQALGHFEKNFVGMEKHGTKMHPVADVRLCSASLTVCPSCWYAKKKDLPQRSRSFCLNRNGAYCSTKRLVETDLAVFTLNK